MLLNFWAYIDVPDTGEAIFGAVELYLDIINLFLHILALLGDS